MVYAFDTLGYARRLKDAGVPQPQAEAHADAAREFVMGELVTRSDLLDLATKSDVLAVKFDLQTAVAQLELRMTVRLGVLLAAAIALLGAILKLT
jgi:hypothetical protein